MRVGSLFSGIGGFDLGFQRAGMDTAFFVERERFCRAVLRKHWPDVPIFDDVRAVGVHNLPPVDLLCGGFPCQDLSAAGKGAGLSGARSGLWSEFARLIGELRPRYVVVENVPLLRSRGLGRVLGEMATLGYDAEWDCLPASVFGAPHQRDRLWLVAYPQGVSEWPGLCADEASPFRWRRPGDGSSSDGIWTPEPGLGRVAYGVPERVDRLRALGNSLVPQVAEWIGRRILEYEAAR